MTRFWQVVEQKARLAFFVTSTKTRPQPGRSQVPRRWACPLPISRASASAQMAVHMGMSSASTGWWWSRQTPSSSARCGWDG